MMLRQHGIPRLNEYLGLKTATSSIPTNATFKLGHIGPSLDAHRHVNRQLNPDVNNVSVPVSTHTIYHIVVSYGSTKVR